MVKKVREEFDVPIECVWFDGAEICELVGSFMLSKLCNVFENKNVWLCRVVGPGFMKHKAIFKKYRLSILIQLNLPIVNFLELQLDLKVIYIDLLRNQIMIQYTLMSN